LTTEILKVENLMRDADNVIKAAKLIQAGEVVAIPTETVYGLAANALDEKAVSKIFEAKGRPQDNPLIVHIDDFSDLEKIVEDVPQNAVKLAEAFWPGPLTMIFKKKDVIPNVVSAGLDTVAVRLPEHMIARAIIYTANYPLAAPSANTSGKPSPTKAEHVYDDMNGKIPAIVDGGSAGVGLESTVVDMTRYPPRLLRPGGITLAQLKSVLGEVEVDDAVVREIEKDAKVNSPGMKYRHYAPNAPLVILDGAVDTACEYLKEQDGKIAVLCFDEEIEEFSKICKNVISYGKENEPVTLANNLFDALRAFDNMNVDKIFAREPKGGEGMELAVINRLQKSAGFTRIKLS